MKIQTGITALLLVATSFSLSPAAPNTGSRVQADPAKAQRMIEACGPIAFIRRANYGMQGTNAVMFSHRTLVGSAICTYDPATPAAAAKTIFETTEGMIFNMNPSYDGKRLVFSYKTAVNQPFHVWEIDADGKGLRQLTDGRYHDFSPVYYPDGRIVFSSSRVESFSLCQNFIACALHIIDGDGRNMRRIDFTTLSTLTPSILRDGSILCTRWEYQDKNIFGWEGLWTINPNGRQLKLFHGNTFRIPNAVYGGREIPGTQKVIVVWSAHHRIPIGDLAIVDRTKGLETPQSMCKITHVTPVEKDLASGQNWRATGIGTREADTLYERAFADPFPFSQTLSLVSFGGDHKKNHNLYILDHDTGESCLLHASHASCFSPVPLAARRLSNVIPGECPQEPGEGTYFVQDVYQGLLEKGVARGQVKALRIMSQDPKKYNTEGPRYHDHYPIVGHGSYYVKHNHGTVPVYADGSAYFKAPSNREIFFIALDAQGKEIQRMGSVCQITTGEHVSCVGCHENRITPPPAVQRDPTWALRRPDPVTPPPWGAGPVDFVKQVQPILDKYCADCHSGPTPDGRVDLSPDKTRFYNMAYESLVFENYVDYYYINAGPNGVFPPLATGSWVSKLTRLIESNHADVVLDDDSRRCIYAWIDTNVPYYGTWEMTRPHTVGGRDGYARTLPGMGSRFATQASALEMIVYEPWVEKYNSFVKQHKIEGAEIVHSGDNGFTPRSRVNLTHPQWSPVLVSNLAQKAGGLADDATALFKSTDDATYKEFLNILQDARNAFQATPRIDMPGAKPITQERDFGKTFGT